ncbi:MAG: c-type cytochrome [Methylococcus sp.]
MKSSVWLITLLLAATANGVSAEPSSTLAWTPETQAAVQRGDAEKGKAAAQSCAACHANGGQFPYLDGQLAPYLYKQLHDYKEGSRKNPIMTGLVAGLSAEDMANLAIHYSQQALPPAPKAEPATDAAVKLVKEGDSRRILAPCAVCHESNGKGQKIDVPAIAGQNAAYLEQTLLDYKSGARRNDLYGRMRDITQQLSADEIKQLAAYYAGLGR